MGYTRKIDGYLSRQTIEEIRAVATSGKRAIYDLKDKEGAEIVLALLSAVESFDEIIARADELDDLVIKAVKYHARKKWGLEDAWILGNAAD